MLRRAPADPLPLALSGVSNICNAGATTVKNSWRAVGSASPVPRFPLKPMDELTARFLSGYGAQETESGKGPGGGARGDAGRARGAALDAAAVPASGARRIPRARRGAVERLRHLPRPADQGWL